MSSDQTVIIHPDGHEFGEKMSFGQRVFYRFMRGIIVVITRTYFRAKVVGGENIPDSGPFILSPIHRSNLDTPFIALATSRRLRYMGKESLWKGSFGAWFFTALGGFPVQRGSADREALRACQVVLDRGEVLVLFPEGTRQFGPHVAHFFDGAAFLSCRTGVPIVPVGLGGTEAAMPKGSKMVHPVRMTIVIGAPLFPPAGNASGRTSRKAIKAMTADLSATTQRLFDEAQVLAGRSTAQDHQEATSGGDSSEEAESST
ncbi:MAG: lysophospholipid acyltransferase family protein [Actinomycetes bacterium]